MPVIENNDLLPIARSLLQISQIIGQYRIDHWDDLTTIRNKELSDYQWSILKTAENLFTEAAVEIGHSVDEDIANLVSNTNELQTAIKRLENVQKIIDIGAAAVALGSAIYGGKIDTIGKSLKALVKVVKAPPVKLT